MNYIYKALKLDPENNVLRENQSINKSDLFIDPSHILSNLTFFAHSKILIMWFVDHLI